MHREIIISTHTPTKGATRRQSIRQERFLISTHTPTKGATIYNIETKAIISISTHTPTKGATKRHEKIDLMAIISTHTPTKGATAILTNNFLIFCSISLIISILYLKIIQILFLFRYKFNFLSHILSANLLLFLCLLYTRITIKSMADQLVFLYLHQNVLL